MKGEVKAKLAKVYPPRRAAVARLFLVDMAVDLSMGKRSPWRGLDRCNSEWVAAGLRRPGSVGVS